MPRFYCPTPLQPGDVIDLPSEAVRHVQVLRLQPGQGITLFNGINDAQGPGGEFQATVLRMGRSQVQVQVNQFVAVQRQPRRAVHLALGMPANERMDWLVEKAAELGVASIQPLMGQRSVLRLTGERALRKKAHWQSIAVAACEQCGGNQVPTVHPVQTLSQWLAQAQRLPAVRLLLSLRDGSGALPQAADGPPVVFLSGPEGGWTPQEEQMAMDGGFQPVTLGPRTLRAETAALAALARMTV